MAPENFEELLGYIKEDILKENTHLRESIPPEVKLAFTITFLASGNSYQDLSMCFRVCKIHPRVFKIKLCEIKRHVFKDT